MTSTELPLSLLLEMKEDIGATRAGVASLLRDNEKLAGRLSEVETKLSEHLGTDRTRMALVTAGASLGSAVLGFIVSHTTAVILFLKGMS